MEKLPKSKTELYCPNNTVCHSSKIPTTDFDDPFDFGYGQEMELDEARGKPDHIFSQCKSLKKSIS